MIESSYPEKRLELAVNVRNINCVNLLIIHHIAENNTSADCCHQNFHFCSKVLMNIEVVQVYCLKVFKNILFLFFGNGKYC